jgi:O-antigen/teichoic acid export membrane protein
VPLMRATLQGLAYQVIGYGVGAAAQRILGIAVACIYPILLSRDEYGRLDVVFSITTLLTVLFFAGLDIGLARFYYESDDPVRRRSLVSTVFYTVVGFTLVAVVLLLAASRPLALWLYGEPRYILYFRLALLGMPFAMVNSVNLVLLRLQRRIRAFNLIMIGNLAVAALFGIASIMLFKISAAGVLIGFIAGHAATGFAGTYINRREFTAMPAVGRLQDLFGIGLPLVVSGASLWLIGYVNRPILVHWVPADDVGLYAIASGGVGMMGLIIAAFRNAWQPFSFSIMGREGSEGVYGRALTLFTIFGATITVCGSLFAPEGLLLINAYTHKNWSGAAPSVGPLAMGTLFGAMYMVVQIGAYIARRTSVIALTMVGAAAINILLNIVLIPRFGILGAAFATAAGHLTALISLYAVAQRIAHIPYQPVKLFNTVVAASAAVILGSYMATDSVVRNLILKITLLISYGIVLLAARVLSPRDLRMLWNVKEHMSS